MGSTELKYHKLTTEELFKLRQRLKYKSFGAVYGHGSPHVAEAFKALLEERELVDKELHRRAAAKN